MECAYSVRMPRVNIWLPEDLHRAAKSLGLPLSELAQSAVAAEVERQRKARLLDTYLAELDTELGPATPDQAAEADDWAANLSGSDAAPESQSRSA